MKIGFKPVYDKNSRILILGSFPSEKSLEKKFYYSHKNNIFWKLLGEILGEKNLKEKTIKEKKNFLLKNKIALWDVYKKVNRIGSKDSNIKEKELNDFKKLKSLNLKAIFYNGRTAYKEREKIKKVLKVEEHIYLPSTSPLHTKKYEEKKLEWKKIKEYLK